MQYPNSTIQRAQRAVRCSPFQPRLFETMRWQSVSLQAIAGSAGCQQRYTQHPLAELAAENSLLWLIQVGVLRREVDGQGLTDSFRLTPLGGQLVEQWHSTAQTWPPPSPRERLQNLLHRWLRFSV
jgi:hypothetical protein